MPRAELSEILFILIMFAVVTIISIVSIYLFVKQFKKEKAAQDESNRQRDESTKEG